MWSAYLIGERGPIGEIRDLRIEGPASRLDALLYRPQGPCAGVILFIHGGRARSLDIGRHDIAVTGVVRRSGCAILSLNYRLAPDTPFRADWKIASRPFAGWMNSARNWALPISRYSSPETVPAAIWPSARLGGNRILS